MARLRGLGTGEGSSHAAGRQPPPAPPRSVLATAPAATDAERFGTAADGMVDHGAMTAARVRGMPSTIGDMCGISGCVWAVGIVTSVPPAMPISGADRNRGTAVLPAPAELWSRRCGDKLPSCHPAAWCDDVPTKSPCSGPSAPSSSAHSCCCILECATPWL